MLAHYRKCIEDAWCGQKFHWLAVVGGFVGVWWLLFCVLCILFVGVFGWWFEA